MTHKHLIIFQVLFFCNPNSNLKTLKGPDLSLFYRKNCRELSHRYFLFFAFPISFNKEYHNNSNTEDHHYQLNKCTIQAKPSF